MAVDKNNKINSKANDITSSFAKLMEEIKLVENSLKSLREAIADKEQELQDKYATYYQKTQALLRVKDNVSAICDENCGDIQDQLLNHINDTVNQLETAMEGFPDVKTLIAKNDSLKIEIANMSLEVNKLDVKNISALDDVTDYKNLMMKLVDGIKLTIYKTYDAYVQQLKAVYDEFYQNEFDFQLFLHDTFLYKRFEELTKLRDDLKNKANRASMLRYYNHADVADYIKEAYDQLETMLKPVADSFASIDDAKKNSEAALEDFKKQNFEQMSNKEYYEKKLAKLPDNYTDEGFILLLLSKKDELINLYEERQKELTDAQRCLNKIGTEPYAQAVSTNNVLLELETEMKKTKEELSLKINEFSEIYDNLIKERESNVKQYFDTEKAKIDTLNDEKNSNTQKNNELDNCKFEELKEVFEDDVPWATVALDTLNLLQPNSCITLELLQKNGLISKTAQAYSIYKRGELKTSFESVDCYSITYDAALVLQNAVQTPNKIRVKTSIIQANNAN